MKPKGNRITLVIIINGPKLAGPDDISNESVIVRPKIVIFSILVGPNEN